MAIPLRILSRFNWADSSGLSSGAAAVGSLPLVNLLDDDIQKIWRSTGSDGDAIIIDLTTVREIGAVALINTNQDLDDTIHVRVSTSDPTGQDGNVYNSGVIASNVDPTYAKFVHFIEPAVFGRYIRLGGLLSAPPWQAGRLVVCPTWIPSHNTSYGREKLWRDFSIVDRSLGGNEFVDIRDQQWGWRFKIMGLSEVEARTQVDELNLRRGINRDILVCLDKDSDNLGRDTVWGRMAMPATQRHDSHNYWTVDFEVWNRN